MGTSRAWIFDKISPPPPARHMPTLATIQKTPFVLLARVGGGLYETTERYAKFPWRQAWERPPPTLPQQAPIAQKVCFVSHPGRRAHWMREARARLTGGRLVASVLPCGRGRAGGGGRGGCTFFPGMRIILRRERSQLNSRRAVQPWVTTVRDNGIPSSTPPAKPERMPGFPWS